MTTQKGWDDPRLRHLSRIERQATVYFWEQLEHALPGRVERLILFGSKARGDARPYSDIDLLLVVDQRTPEMEDVIAAVTTDLLLEERVDIQVRAGGRQIQRLVQKGASSVSRPTMSANGISLQNRLRQPLPRRRSL